MKPANTGLLKKVMGLSVALGAMMAVSTHSFAEDNKLVALFPANAVPAHNDWRQLGLNENQTRVSYQFNAGALFKDAFVGLRSLFVEEDESPVVSMPTHQLVVGFGDAPYIDNSGSPAPKIMGKTASTATDMIENIFTTAWVDQEVRSLKRRDGKPDFDSTDPWRMGIRLNMPF